MALIVLYDLIGKSPVKAWLMNSWKSASTRHRPHARRLLTPLEHVLFSITLVLSTKRNGWSTRTLSQLSNPSISLTTHTSDCLTH